MQMRSFTAPDMQLAMAMARDELGDEAVMLSSDSQSDGSVVVTFAIDRTNDSPMFDEPAPRPTGNYFQQEEQRYEEPEDYYEEEEAYEEEEDTPPQVSSILKSIHETLDYHGTPKHVQRQLLQTAQALSLGAAENITELQDAFAKTLEHHFRFEPFNLQYETVRIILVGPPGMGKTNTAAKIAAKMVVDNREVQLVSVDHSRAAGNEQLVAFAKILGVKLKTARNRNELKEIIKKIPPTTSIIVDSAGCNPYDFQELKALGEFATLHDLEPILVCSAGIDAGEAEEIASVFSFLDIERMLIARTDCSRRFGGMLAAATAGDYGFCHITSSPKVMGAFDPLDAASLSELLIQYQRERKAA